MFPYRQKEIKLIERMQRLATRYLKSFRKLSYPEHLHELKLPSMECHFLRATLITVYKLFHGYLNSSAQEFFEVACVVDYEPRIVNRAELFGLSAEL